MRSSCIVAVGPFALLACGTDTFNLGDAAGDASPDATADAHVMLDAAMESGDEPVGNPLDAPVMSDVVVACMNSCVTCAQGTCLVQNTTCSLDTTCKAVVAAFVACRCAGSGTTCNPPVANSTDIPVELFATCLKNSCACGF